MLVANKIIFFSVFLFTSCSTIQFNSSEIIPLNFNNDLATAEDVSVEVEKSFYLWGMIPSKASVEVDKIFEAKGADSVSKISIAEVKPFKKAFWMVLSAGLYYPQTYMLSGKMTR